jgi:hypothetical protein
MKERRLVICSTPTMHCLLKVLGQPEDHHDDDTLMFTSDNKGYLYATSQVEDYMLRGTAFEDMNFMDFTVETYEIQRTRRDNITMDEQEAVTSALGRKKNVRSLYCEGHRRFETHERVQRSKNHNYMPNIIGRWFPRRDVLGDEDFYFASLLVFLRPWRDLGQLRAAHRTWKEEGLHFLDSTTTEQRDVIAGMQYYYDSKTAAQHLSEDDNDDPTNQILDTEMGIDEEDEFENQLKVNCVVRCV